MIRAFCSADCDAVVQVWDEATRVAHAFLCAEFLVHEKHQIRFVHLQNAEVWVSEQHGVISGFIALRDKEVGAIFVRPTVQRTGQGHALMAHAQSLHGELEVEVFERNSIGRAFYDKCGFEPTERKVHEPTGERLMRLRLAALPVRFERAGHFGR